MTFRPSGARQATGTPSPSVAMWYLNVAALAAVGRIGAGEMPPAALGPRPRAGVEGLGRGGRAACKATEHGLSQQTLSAQRLRQRRRVSALGLTPVEHSGCAGRALAQKAPAVSPTRIVSLGGCTRSTGSAATDRRRR